MKIKTMITWTYTICSSQHLLVHTYIGGDTYGVLRVDFDSVGQESMHSPIGLRDGKKKKKKIHGEEMQ